MPNLLAQMEGELETKLFQYTLGFIIDILYDVLIDTFNKVLDLENGHTIIYIYSKKSFVMLNVTYVRIRRNVKCYKVLHIL